MKNKLGGMFAAGFLAATTLYLLAACGAPTSPHPQPVFVDCAHPENFKDPFCAIPEWEPHAR